MHLQQFRSVLSYTSEDFEEFNKHGINTLKTDSHLTTVVQNNKRILVPIFFEDLFFGLHILQLIKGFHKLFKSWERKILLASHNKQIAEFLSHCVCAKKKTDKSKKKHSFLHSTIFLKAEKVLQICAIDIYSYESRHY